QSYVSSSNELRQTFRIGSRRVAGFRTGDRVARRGDELLFLGRMDHEYKISGHRVHPREIEEEILRIGGIKEACVLGITSLDGRRRLTAFVSLAVPMPARAIRETLQLRLPAAMVPSVFEIMAS